MAYSLLATGMDDLEDHPEYAASVIPSSTKFDGPAKRPAGVWVIGSLKREVVAFG
jgi:hypothetical protein